MQTYSCSKRTRRIRNSIISKGSSKDTQQQEPIARDLRAYVVAKILFTFIAFWLATVIELSVKEKEKKNWKKISRDRKRTTQRMRGWLQCQGNKHKIHFSGQVIACLERWWCFAWITQTHRCWDGWFHSNIRALGLGFNVQSTNILRM